MCQSWARRCKCGLGSHLFRPVLPSDNVPVLLRSGAVRPFAQRLPRWVVCRPEFDNRVRGPPGAEGVLLGGPLLALLQTKRSMTVVAQQIQREERRCPTGFSGARGTGSLGMACAIAWG